MKFKIGDKVWIARAGNFSESWITCPDCLGQKSLTVITGNGSYITIDCECCKAGYEGCKGQIKVYGFLAVAHEIEINEISVDNGKVEYNHEEESNVFLTKVEAESRAEQFRARYESEELNRLNFMKENPKKSWAWNASYHRKNLKEALRQVEYHSSKLNVAKLKSKEQVIEDVNNLQPAPNP